jgi:multisubunit Na+/H+ antiporter MnhE subunit
MMLITKLPKRVMHGLILILTFSWDLLVSNFQVFLMSISPQPLWNPGFVKVDFSPKLTDLQLTILAHMVTATPGTLTVDVNREQCFLNVHVLYRTLNIKEEMTHLLKKMEHRVCHVF